MTDVLDKIALAYHRGGGALPPDDQRRLFMADPKLVTPLGEFTEEGLRAVLRGYALHEEETRRAIAELILAGGSIVGHLKGHADDVRDYTKRARHLREIMGMDRR